jgi:hypothetical protein
MADFLVTFKCPSKCRHCCYRAGPERTGSMQLGDMQGYLEELCNTQPLESVGAHGGEPFLYFELLSSFFEKAKELGIEKRWVITNGFWAKTEKIAKMKLKKLNKAGLGSITFSVDGFHQEFISLDTVRKGIEAAVEIDFERVCVDSYFLGHPDLANSYNVVTRRALEELSNLEGVEFHLRKADLEGRGAELASIVQLKKEIPMDKCQAPFWIGEDIEDPRGVEIDFAGNVTLCPGILIGNAKSHSLSKILENYNCSEHPILSIIAREGPMGLWKLALEKGYSKKRDFADECHLCYEMRRFLWKHYPEHLAPKNCYFENISTQNDTGKQ